MSRQPSNLGPKEQRLWKLIENTPAPGKHAARSAVFHLESASLIRELDPNMAVFRLITAEEEAATAVFHALQRRRYANAKKLNRKKHKHKAALLPFVAAILDVVRRQVEILEPQLAFNKEKGDELRVRVKIRGPDRKLYWLYPDPPLGFMVHVDDQPYDFRPDVEQFLLSENVKRFAHLVEDRANERNRLLYASEKGVPRVVGDLERVSGTFHNNVFGLLALYVLIDTVSKRQQFVEQALDAFVRLMKLVPDVDA